jgi:hypothetical protein
VRESFNVRFWHNMWCVDMMTLKDAFSVLFGMACAKDAVVTAHLGLCGGSNRENVSFTIVAHDKKVDIFAFFRMLYLIRARQVLNQSETSR